MLRIVGRGRKPRPKYDDDDDDDDDDIDMGDAEPDAPPVSTRKTRKKPVLEFSSDDDFDFDESASTGCCFIVFMTVAWWHSLGCYW